MKNLVIIQNKILTFVIEIISTSLIFLFVYTAISKIITHDLFLYNLDRSPLLRRFSLEVSWVIPVSEISISILLLIPKWRHQGLFYSFIIMSLFTLYIAYMIAFTPQLPCSCGGIIKDLTWPQHLILNTFFTIAALIGWRFTKRNKDFIAINRISRTPV